MRQCSRHQHRKCAGQALITNINVLNLLKLKRTTAINQANKSCVDQVFNKFTNFQILLHFFYNSKYILRRAEYHIGMTVPLKAAN